jgi:pseudaminic acid synthase
MNIGGVEIGGGHPCRFVAEMSNSFNGDPDRLRRMIVAAKEAGADLVKLQAYLPDELIALRGDGPAPDDWGRQGYTMRTLYERARTPLEWFDWIPDHCAWVGIPWFSSVFGAESLGVLERANCPAYKVARLDNSQYRLVDAVIATGKPYLVSAGPNDRPCYTMFDHPDPEYVRKRPGGWHVSREHLLWCPEGYPQTDFGFSRGAAGTDYNDCGTDGTFGENHVGFSYHGTDPRPCIVAATIGAKLIEAHFMLDAEPSEIEASVSLGESAFRHMVAEIRANEAILP